MLCVKVETIDVKKIGVCGCVGVNDELLNGQTIKTKQFIDYVKTRKDITKIVIVDTWGWHERKYALFLDFIHMMYEVDDAYIFPAHNGVKVFIPLAVFLSFFIKVNVYYMVIGGWLVDLLKKNSVITFFVRYLKNIYVETKIMKDELNAIDINNVEVVHNYKNYEQIKYNISCNCLRYCTLSRVIKEKGVEDAIDAVIEINNSNQNQKIYLDIYGQIDENYKDEFKTIISCLPEYIHYCGEVESNNVVKVLSNYRVLLFPTHYYTEGQPGTIIDAYFAGIPVIAYEWRSADEFIINNKTGWVIKRDLNQLINKIKYVNDIELVEIKHNCQEEALKYTSENVLSKIL